MSPIELTALIDCQPEFQQKLQAYMDIVQEFQAAQIQAMADYEAAANTWRQTHHFQELKNYQQTLQLLNLRDEYLDGGWKFASAQNGDMTNGERLKNAMYNAVDEVAPAVKYLLNQEEFWEERDDKAFLMRAQIRDLLEKHIGEAAQLVEVKTLHQLWKEDPVMYDAISKTTNGFFMPKADRAVLVADSFIKNPEYAVWTAYHELGHRGIHLQGRELWDEWLQEAQKNPTVKAIADSTQRIYANKGHSLNDIQATEEAMVEIFAAYKTGQWEFLSERHQVEISNEFKKPQGTVARLWNSAKEKIGKIFNRQPESLPDSAVFAMLGKLEQSLYQFPERMQYLGNLNMRFDLFGNNGDLFGLPDEQKQAVIERAQKAIQSGANAELAQQLAKIQQGEYEKQGIAHAQNRYNRQPDHFAWSG